MTDAKGQLDSIGAQAIGAALGLLPRSAAASIRGYLTQFVYSALAWCELDENCVIVVEGREDLDQLILNPDGTVREITEIQIKDLSHPVNARSEPVWRSIFNFLLSYSYHRADNRQPRMIFATTTDFKDQVTSEGSALRHIASGVRLGLPVDVISTWRSLPELGDKDRTLAVAKLTQSVKALFEGHLRPHLVQDNNRNTESTFAQLVYSTMDRYTVTEWSDFFAAVSWTPQLESAASLTERLEARIACHPMLKGLPAAELARILIYEVLNAASRKEVTARILTHDRLASIASQSANTLIEWARDMGMENLDDWQLRVEEQLAQHDERMNKLAKSVAEVMPSQSRARDRVRDFSAASRRSVKVTIGSLTLDRSSTLEGIQRVLEGVSAVMLTGPSGAGKSALARILSETLDEQGGLSLWLAASSLERPDLAALNADITKEMSLPEVFEAHPGQRMLVFDGLDRAYESSALKLAADLMRALRIGQEGALSQVLITCQTADREALERSLLREGMDTSAWCVIECRAPSTEELAPVWAAVPSLRQMLPDPRVALLLQNLKILDIAVERAQEAAGSMSQHFVGETSVAAWFWSSTVVRGPRRRSRDRFVLKLAEHQADQLRLSTPITALSDDEGLIDALEIDQICLVDERNNVLFAHDLYADWARLRLLSQSDDLPGYLEKRLDSPLWHRAVRLLGADFLDVQQDVHGWKTLLNQLQDIGGSFAADLLLESIVFSANTPDHLSLLCAELLDQGASLLDRLLGRFLVFATLPDPRIQALVRSKEWDAAQAASSHRCPNTAYWPAVLMFLYRHRDQVVQLVPERVGQVVKLWLEHTSPDAPLRRETAEIGLLLGRFALDQHKLNCRKLLFEAALAGAYDCTGEVCRFALEACERTTVRVCQANAVTDPYFDPYEPLPASYPDGPKNPVDKVFRGVVLEGRALRPLMRVAPAIAREVSLACLLSSRNPAFRNQNTREWDSDLCNVLAWPTAASFQGPFIDLLNLDFNEGLETVVRLVDFVADQWLKRRQQDEHGQESGPFPDSGGKLICQTDTGMRVYLGDCRIFGWSSALGSPHPSSIVTSALMALEEYLYRRIESGADIDGLVAAVMGRAQSVPFLGMLLDIGRRSPQLFNGALMPLLGIPELFFWDSKVRARGRDHLSVTSPTQNPLLRAARAHFNMLPHRNRELLQVAAQCLFDYEQVSTFMAKKVQDWAHPVATLEPGETRDDFKRLILVFTEDNYQPDEKGKKVNTALQKWEAERHRTHDSGSDKGLFVFVLRCDRLLKHGGLAEDALPAFLEELHLVEKRWINAAEEGYGPAKTSFEDLLRGTMPVSVPADAFAAGIAVLVCQHHGWVVQQEGLLQWCIDSLFDIASNPPPRDGWDASDAVSVWTWDRFSVQASDVLWRKNPDDNSSRELLAFFAFSDHDETIARLMRGVAAVNPPRFNDLQRLRRIVFEVAYLRKRIEFVRLMCRRRPNAISHDELQQAEAELWAWKCLQIEGFILSQSELPAQSWVEMDTSGFFGSYDDERARYDGYQIDFSLIRAAHEQSVSIDSSVSPEERAYRIWFLSSALEFWCSLMINRERRAPDFLDEDQIWLFKQLAKCVGSLSHDDDLQLIWRRMLTLPKRLLSWTEQFLEELFDTTLRAEQISESTLVLISSCYECACTRRDSDRWNEDEDVWLTLFGIGSFTVHLWKAKHGQLAERLWPWIKQWVTPLTSAMHAAAVAQWLVTPATLKLRLQSLEIFQYLPDISSQIWGKLERKSIEDSVAELLHLVWKERSEEVRRSTPDRHHFQRLLRWLAECQHPRGLALIGQIGGL